MGDAVPDEVQPNSPDWWVARLYKKLVGRQDSIDFFSDYYRGEHPLPWLAPQARDEFRRLVRMTRSNYMGLVVDAMVERITVEGFRFGADANADAETWRLWQANNLDSDSDMAWLEAAISGYSYWMVAPNPADVKTPHIWVEHPSQAIVEHEPGTNRRVRKAGLKVWKDDWTGKTNATLYLMENGKLWLYKYQGESKSGAPVERWIPRSVAGESWPADGQMDRLPLVEIPNNPRLLHGGVSELYDLTDIQDRVNKTLFDRMQTQEFGVDPQKWAKGFPDEDSEGNANVIEFGRNRMVTSDVAETAFGNFAVAPLDPYSNAKREDVKDIASRSRTPAQYLLGEMSNVNGETLKASESGLISKVRQRCRPFGEATEEAMRLARSLAGIATPDDFRMEAIFTNPQYRTEGELTDAVVKKLQSGIASLRKAREDVGYSQTEIARLEEDDQTAALDPVTSELLAKVRAGAGNGA